MFSSGGVAGLPKAVRRYLQHAIAPGTVLATAVRPDGGSFRAVDFGGVAEDEQTFGGYTIPTRLRVGWYVGSPQFEPAGQFFRVTIDDARYC